MDLAALVRLAILASMMLLVFALGLRSDTGVATYLFRRPGLLIRSLLAMNLVAPLLVVWLVTTFDLRPAVKIALVALAVSPVPPFLPGKELKLVVGEGFTYGLFVASGLLAVVLVPASMALLVWLGPGTEHVRFDTVLRIVAMTVLIPLVLGMVVHRVWPQFALRGEPIAKRIGTVLLVVALIPVLVAQWPAVRSLLGDGTLLAIAAASVLSLAVGHVLGGPNPENRTVLALSTASRHPAVAIAVASASFPDYEQVPAAVLLALVVSMIAAAPYTAWRKRTHAADVHAARPDGRVPGHR